MPEGKECYHQERRTQFKIQQINEWQSGKEENTLLKYKNKTIKKRSDGRYFVRYRHDGKQYSIYGKTGQECLLKLKKALKTLNGKADTTNTLGKYKQITVSQWFREWERLYKINEWSKETRESNRGVIKNHINPTIGKILIKNLQVADLQNALANINFSRQREKAYTIIKDAFTRLQEIKVIDILTKENFKKPKHTKKEAKALTREEEQDFLDCSKKNKYNLAFQITLYQGLRLEEVLALNYEDINIKDKTLSITKAIDRRGNIIKPKTKNSKRIIPLFKRTYEAIKEQKLQQGRMFQISKAKLEKHFAKVREIANLDGFTFHGLRHTFGTRCAEAGITPKQTQLWMGHADITTTLKYYTHINKEFEEKNINIFDTHFDTQK